MSRYEPVNRDHRLHRCWWCGDWQLGRHACTTCAAPAEHPTTSQHTTDHKESA